MNAGLDRDALGTHYSPHLRTALVLTGTGTAGAYHAGVLRALHEAGVKIDVVAGRGVGVIGALFAAIDGAPRLWDDRGFWRARGVRSFYAWRPVLRFMAAAVAVAIAIVAVPLLAMAAGLVVFPIDFLMKIAGAGSGGLVARYVAFAQAAFAPTALPTWLPRLAMLVLGAGGLLAALSAWIGRGSRRRRGPFWWRVLPSPLTSHSIVTHAWQVMWEFVRGAAAVKLPSPADLGRRYTELLADNLGQPGFRELVVLVHDVDMHRDLVFALVGESRRRHLIKRATSEAAEARRAEVFDLTGVARDYIVDAVAAALAVPIATEAHALAFAPDAYWQGETHRVCDRPASLLRLLQELAGVGVEQAIVASAASGVSGPHALAPPRLDGRGRLGEYLQSMEAAAMRDAVTAGGGITRLFTIQPIHNPIGPFDFRGGYDDRSDRAQPLTELMNRGYQDAYQQFVEPVVGASGERVGRPA